MECSSTFTQIQIQSIMQIYRAEEQSAWSFTDLASIAAPLSRSSLATLSLPYNAARWSGVLEASSSSLIIDMSLFSSAHTVLQGMMTQDYECSICMQYISFMNLSFLPKWGPRLHQGLLPCLPWSINKQLGMLKIQIAVLSEGWGRHQFTDRFSQARYVIRVRD